jgi:adenine C2-methylase RlmN of 23S rRNA A2503 and tRNA A37
LCNILTQLSEFVHIYIIFLYCRVMTEINDYTDAINAAVEQEPEHITSDYVGYFGDEHDGVIEYVGKTQSSDGLFEAGYYCGDTKPKPIIGISAMMGCPAQCNFCELGPEKFVRPLSAVEMYEQVIMTLRFASSVINISRQHKVNVAKSGEPLLNPQLVEGLGLIGMLGFSIKVSTVFPKGPVARRTLEELAQFASTYTEPVQPQISLISTSDAYRSNASGKLAASLAEIREGVDMWTEVNPQPNGRKVNLSLILTQDTPADPEELARFLPPELVNVRLRDYIPTQSGGNSGLETIQDERYKDLAERFRSFGYVASEIARPTTTEHRFRLVSNSTLTRYLEQTKPW